MSDATTGSAAAAIAGTPDVTNVTTTPVTDAPASSSVAQPPAAQPDTWYKDAPDDVRGWLEKKGYKDMGEALKGHLNLERAFGGDKIVMPKEATDEAGWNAVYDKLGRPKAATDYKVPEGVDSATAMALAPELHKLGLNQRQVEALSQIDIKRQTEAGTAEQQRAITDQADGLGKLRAEWGNNAAIELEATRRAAKAFGMDQATLDKAFAAVGTEKMMRILHANGSAMKEDNTAGIGDAGMGFGLSQDRARYEIAQKNADPLFRKRLDAGDKQAKAVWNRLHQAASGEA